MPTQQRRLFFSETVTHPGDGGGGSAAVSLGSLLRSAGWGFIVGANNAKGTDQSLDSFIATNGEFVPTIDCFVGHDQYVSSAAAVGPPRLYKGVLAAGGLPFDLVENFPPPVAADDVFIYSASQAIQLVWQGI